MVTVISENVQVVLGPEGFMKFDDIWMVELAQYFNFSLHFSDLSRCLVSYWDNLASELFLIVVRFSEWL